MAGWIDSDGVRCVSSNASIMPGDAQRDQDIRQGAVRRLWAKEHIKAIGGLCETPCLRRACTERVRMRWGKKLFRGGLATVTN